MIETKKTLAFLSLVNSWRLYTMRYKALKSEIYGNPNQMISLYRDVRGETYANLKTLQVPFGNGLERDRSIPNKSSHIILMN